MSGTRKYHTHGRMRPPATVPLVRTLTSPPACLAGPAASIHVHGSKGAPLTRTHRLPAPQGDVEIYGVKVGRDLISKVTDAVIEDVRAWQTRPLDDVYPVLFLDALVLKIHRDRHREVARPSLNRPAVAGKPPRSLPGIPSARRRQQIRMSLTPRFFRSVRTGHPELCALVGMEPHPEHLALAVPLTTVQTCIVHLIRESLKYVPRRQYDAVVKDLKPIYTALDADAALVAHAAPAVEVGFGGLTATVTTLWRVALNAPDTTALRIPHPRRCRLTAILGA
jgi:hypothetical protein